MARYDLAILLQHTMPKRMLMLYFQSRCTCFVCELKFGFCDYLKSMSDVQSIGQPVDGDSVIMNINGVVQTMNTSRQILGRKVPLEFNVEGQQLR